MYLCVFSQFKTPGMQVQVSACIKYSACTSTSWPVLKAVHVSALVGVHSEQFWYLVMLSCIEGFAYVCIPAYEST